MRDRASAASCGITVRPGKLRAAIRAVSVLGAMAMLDWIPRERAWLATAWAICWGSAVEQIEAAYVEQDGAGVGKFGLGRKRRRTLAQRFSSAAGYMNTGEHMNARIRPRV